MLKFWLPLNKDTRMVGLSPTSATSYSNMTIKSEATPVAEKCGYGLSVYHMATDDFDNKFTVATWLRGDTTFPQYNKIISCKNTSASTGCHWYLSIISGNTLYFQANDASISSSYQFELNTWYHVAATFDGKILKTFVDGNFIKSGVTSSEKREGCLNIGIGCRATNNAGTQVTGDYFKFNDLRIYSHTLKEWEIKDLYNRKVFGVYGNLFLEETTNLVSNIASAGKDNVAYDVATWATTVSSVTNKNGVYTFSAYITNTSDHPLNCRLSCYNSAGTGYNAIQGNSIPAGSEGRSVVTCNTTNTSNFNGTIYLYIQNGNAGVDPTNKRFYLREVQFEEKDHATPPSYGHRDARLADISNYNHDMTLFNVVKSGSSIYFNGTNSAIQIPAHAIISGGTWSVNFWFYRQEGEWGTKRWETIFGGPSGFELSSKNASASTSVIYMYSWGSKTAAYECNKWNMVTMTRTSSEVKLYVNGELKVTSTTVGSMPQGNYYIGSWRDTTSQNFRGYIRKFSLYKTVLTEEEIKNLYYNNE